MKTYISPRSKFSSLRERWIKLVATNENVTRGDIIIKLGLTPQQYYLNASLILETANTIMEYDKLTKMWNWIGGPLIDKPVIQEEEIPIEDEGITQEKEMSFEDEGIKNDPS